MSRKERDRLKIMAGVKKEELTLVQAGLDRGVRRPAVSIGPAPRAVEPGAAEGDRADTAERARGERQPGKKNDEKQTTKWDILL